MPAHTISEEWKLAFGRALPAGFLCRTVLSACWLRVHSLPGSKRYPESAQECSELLGRQNTVAEYTLGEGSECVLFFTRFGQVKEFDAEDLPMLGGVPEHVMSFYDESGDDEYQFFAHRVTWQNQKFNNLIVARANDQTGPILFANTATRSIYAPYDGGADLFFPSPKDVQAARSHLSNWCSARTDGL